MVQSNDKFFTRAAAAVFLLTYSLLTLLGPFLLQDADTMMHIRTGQWILTHLQFPTVDFYSYTKFGKPWISTEWLAEIFYAAAFALGGWRAVTILAAAACAGIVSILCFYLLRHLRFSIAVGWAAITIIASGPHFIARPHVFAYVILIIWIISLLDSYDNESFDLPSTFVLAPLMVLWANLHGSFTFGLTLLYIFACICFYHNIIRHDYAKCRRIVLVAAAVTACAFVTPYGYLPIFMTTKLLSMKFVLTYIVEWRTPDFQHSLYRTAYLVGIWLAIAGLGIRLRGARLIAFGLITFTGLRYIRGLLMFFFLAPIILARPLAAAVPLLGPAATIPEGDKGTDPVLNFLRKQSSAILAGCMGLAALVTVSDWWRNDIVPPKIIAPQAAIDFVRRAEITGNVFNSYQFGGYLIFSGIPTFIDGRAELFGDAFVKNYVETVDLTDIKKAFGVLDEYKVNWALLAPKEPLVSALAQNVGWNKVYSDQYAVVFVRRR